MKLRPDKINEKASNCGRFRLSETTARFALPLVVERTFFKAVVDLRVLVVLVEEVSLLLVSEEDEKKSLLLLLLLLEPADSGGGIGVSVASTVIVMSGGGTDVSIISNVWTKAGSCLGAVVLQANSEVDIDELSCRCSDGSTLKSSSANEHPLEYDSLLLGLFVAEVIETLKVVGLETPSITGPINELATSANSPTAYSENCLSTYSHLLKGVTVTSLTL
jgi:hypothetical protein